MRGKAGQRSLARSALVEAAERLTRALAQIVGLLATPALRREQIKLQVALANALMHVKGYAAPEPKAAVERARLLIEQAEALGEPLEDPLLLFSVLYGLWGANLLAFNGDVVRELASQFLTLAEKQGATVPLMIGNRIMGHFLLLSGEFSRACAHYNKAVSLYDAVEHRSLATRFGQDTRVAILSLRSLARCLLGYPDTARADADLALGLGYAQEIGFAGTLMFAQFARSLLLLVGRDHSIATAQARDLSVLADEKTALLWQAAGIVLQGCSLVENNKSAEAVRSTVSGITATRSTGSTLFIPTYLSHLAKAHAQLGQFDDAFSCIDEAIALVATSGERWCEAEIHRIAGEIALMGPEPDAAKAETPLSARSRSRVPNKQSHGNCRASTSMARLWRDQGKRGEACELLAPVYVWFTEGFDTMDLKEAKALLEALA
jgi:predicted ATPase